MLQYIFCRFCPHTGAWLLQERILGRSMLDVCVCVCVCCRPIYSGRRFHLLGAPAGVTQKEGQHTGDFYFLFVLVIHLPFAVLAFSSSSREGFSTPFPSSIAKSNLCTHDKVALHCWVLCEKKPQITPRFEPATQPSEGYEVTN